MENQYIKLPQAGHMMNIAGVIGWIGHLQHKLSLSIEGAL